MCVRDNRVEEYFKYRKSKIVVFSFFPEKFKKISETIS